VEPDMANPSADRLAEKLRAARKDQTLSGAAIADRVEELTGSRPSDVTVSRWLTGRKKLIRVYSGGIRIDDKMVHIDPMLPAIAAAHGLDLMDLIEDVVRNTSAEEDE